jgi:hypothetical protein
MMLATHINCLATVTQVLGLLLLLLPLLLCLRPRWPCLSQEYLFRNITRDEWEPLFSFIEARKIRIENLQEARHGPRGPGGAGGWTGCRVMDLQRFRKAGGDGSTHSIPPAVP